MSRQQVVLILIILLAGFLRFRHLSDYGLWVDECLYVGYVQDGASQEHIPQIFGYIFGVETDLQTRLPFAICSTLTVLALYYVIPNKKTALSICAVFATLPLFVWWGHLARPYAIAGLFMVLAWRNPYWLIPAILTTPISLLGLNIYDLKKNWKVYTFILILTIVLYFIRSDYDRGHWSVATILTGTRWWYLPILGLLLHCAKFMGFLTEPKPKKNVRRIPIVGLVKS